VAAKSHTNIFPGQIISHYRHGTAPKAKSVEYRAWKRGLFCMMFWWMFLSQFERLWKIESIYCVLMESTDMYNAIYNIFC